MERNTSRRLPDFLVIGAAKAGTTTLHHYLDLNPQIYMSLPKEPCFFSDDDVYAKGLEWYSSLWSLAQPDQSCGEASTRYSRYPQYPEAAPRIAELLPQVKLIYIMRHPIDRAYSHHVHEIATGQNKSKTTFEDGIKKHSYILDCSDYIKQIQWYLRFFSKDNFLFILTEDLESSPQTTIDKIFEFIGVDSINFSGNSKPILKNTASDRYERFMRAKITGSLKRIPGISLLKSLLSNQITEQGYELFTKSPLYRGYAKKQSYLPPPMLPETRQMLIERFKKSNQELSEILNRDLSHWME